MIVRGIITEFGALITVPEAFSHWMKMRMPISLSLFRANTDAVTAWPLLTLIRLIAVLRSDLYCAELVRPVATILSAFSPLFSHDVTRLSVVVAG
ncbi:MAG: hypothetical protein DI564_18235, partial [Rhodanobacter denitrificans]